MPTCEFCAKLFDDVDIIVVDSLNICRNCLIEEDVTYNNELLALECVFSCGSQSKSKKPLRETYKEQFEHETTELRMKKSIILRKLLRDRLLSKQRESQSFTQQ